MTYRDLTVTEGLDAIRGDDELRVLDVRTEPEYRSHRIDGATLIPVQELALRLDELEPGAKYLVTCEHGIRSVAACQLLAQAGFSELSNLAGGMAQWVAEGLPAVSG